jgi:hypothetical protein
MLSIVGSLIGFGSSFLPKVMDFFQDKQDKKHELSLQDKVLESQLKLGVQKLEATKLEGDTKEIEVIHKEHRDITLKASKFFVNLSASVRPVITYVFFLEFMLLTLAVFRGWITKEQFQMIWNTDIQAVWAGVVCFWFGSRSFNRKGHT